MPPGGQPLGTVVSGHTLLPDLQDMSLVTLSTKTPKDFSSRHRLVLHVAKSEMDKVRVFQATGESSWPAADPTPPPRLGFVPAPVSGVRRLSGDY